jgi:Flp pilus assembly pilin Flp
MVRTIVRIWTDRSGQDLIEYALLASFVCVCAAVVLPQTIMPPLCTIYSRVTSLLIRFGNGQG